MDLGAMSYTSNKVQNSNRFDRIQYSPVWEDRDPILVFNTPVKLAKNRTALWAPSM